MTDSLQYGHLHDFHDIDDSNVKRVIFVIVITLITMAAEILSGWMFKSMALLSDGIHMATHVSALGITLTAYYIARKNRGNEKYVFGTWKVEILGAYTSALFLGVVGFFVIYSSIERMINPKNIQYNQALLVTSIGLVVNIVSALILKGKTQKSHQDLNIKSAYLHVLADALTSVFALIALLGAKFFSWNILDALMGIVSALLIFKWAVSLLKDTAGILVDRENSNRIENKIKETMEKRYDAAISDLHVWRIGPEKYNCMLALVSEKPARTEDYKKSLMQIEGIVHSAVEVIKPSR